MVYLRMDTPAANVQNLETLRKSIEDFAREDLLLVVEFLTYQLQGESKEDFEVQASIVDRRGFSYLP